MAQNGPAGQRLLVHVVDYLAQTKPDAKWWGVPLDDNDIKKGYKYYTFADFANAVNALAYCLDDQLGGKSETRKETITYIGANDAAYLVIVLAAVKTGRQALLVSPRNSLEAQLSLMEKTNSHAIAYPKSHAAIVAPWLEKRPMKSVTMPPTEELMTNNHAPSYPYTRTFEEDRFETLVVLHTSGSTGIPKPINVRHGLIALIDAYREVEDFEGCPNWLKFITNNSETLFSPFPLFHAAGLDMTLGMSLYYEQTIACPPASKPVSVGLLEECIRASASDGTFLTPSILEEMNDDPESIKLLASQNLVITGSGNVATSVGNNLVKNGVQLHNVLASTEFVPYPMFRQDVKDWAYFHINDEVAGLDWRPAGDDVYELFVKRREKDPGFQGCFYTFPDLDEWSTRDLYKKHPTRPNCWIYYGRADNIVVFSNGEKLNPVSIEDGVMGHPKVKGALVVGENRFQPALLIEPLHYPANEDEAQAFLDEIWPNVEEVNRVSVSHGYIERSLISLVPAEKPFPRSGKGGIQRAMALTTYKDEINAVYDQAAGSSGKKGPQLDFSSLESLMASLKQSLEGQLHADEIGPDTDFFSAGMNSLQALSLSRTLKTQAPASDPGADTDGSVFSPRALYSHPTIRGLASFVWAQLHPSMNGQSSSSSATTSDAMREKYSKNLPLASSLAPASKPATKDLTVLLTGSTGSIGSYILDFLNRDSKVKRVIALNRSGNPADPQKRQAISSASRGLAETYPKTTFLTADLGQPSLGLDERAYQDILENVDTILHNQWQVNFNLSLPSFEPHVRGVRNLIDLSTASQRRPRIVFVTTVAEVSGWQPATSDGSVPESAMPHHRIPADQGYGAGKLAASQLLDAAAEISGVPVAVVRVGQVAGPVDRPQGSWNRWEWFPSIVASSAHLGVLPRTLGGQKGDKVTLDAVAWAPVEREAALLVDVALASGDAGVGYFNGVNSHAGSYAKDVLPVLQERLGLQKDENVVDWSDWLAKLTASEPNTHSDEEINKNPGVKLLGFYESLSHVSENDTMVMKWDAARGKAVSSTWANLEAVQPAWVRAWSEQWGF